MKPGLRLHNPDFSFFALFTPSFGAAMERRTL